MILLYSFVFLIGLVVLYFGAEWLVRGAASIALKYGIRPMVVGLTVVALGTSMPEFVINFFAAMTKEDSLALGNIVGSNICNIALILGTSSVILPMTVTPGTLSKEYPIMMAAMVVFYGLAADGIISKSDGLFLVAGLVGFLLFLVLDARRNSSKANLDDLSPDQQAEATITRWKKVFFLVGGITFLAAGARMMVYAAVEIAYIMGIAPIVVGLTIVAIGTSLPELAASLVSALKNESAMSMGNVLGSNLLNILFVVGLVSLISPLQVDTDSISIHFPVMIAFGVLLLPLARTSYRITRIEGASMLIAFVGYMAYLVAPYV